MKQLLTKYDNLYECSFPYSMGWHGNTSASLLTVTSFTLLSQVPLLEQSLERIARELCSLRPLQLQS